MSYTHSQSSFFLCVRYGRRFILLLSIALQTVFGVAVAFAPNFPVYVTLRFIVGATISGVIINAFVLGINKSRLTQNTCLMLSAPFSLSPLLCLLSSQTLHCFFPLAGTEWTCTKRRMLAGIMTDYAFGLGYTLLAGIAYLIRDWRKLQLAISAPGFLLIFYIWWDLNWHLNVRSTVYSYMSCTWIHEHSLCDSHFLLCPYFWPPHLPASPSPSLSVVCLLYLLSGCSLSLLDGCWPRIEKKKLLPSSGRLHLLMAGCYLQLHRCLQFDMLKTHFIEMNVQFVQNKKCRNWQVVVGRILLPFHR